MKFIEILGNCSKQQEITKKTKKYEERLGNIINGKEREMHSGRVLGGQAEKSKNKQKPNFKKIGFSKIYEKLI